MRGFFLHDTANQTSVLVHCYFTDLRTGYLTTSTAVIIHTDTQTWLAARLFPLITEITRPVRAMLAECSLTVVKAYNDHRRQNTLESQL